MSNTHKNENIDYNSIFKTVLMKNYKGDNIEGTQDYEIQKFWFDRLVSEEEKEHYYMMSPVIIEGIESQDNKKEIYDKLYTETVMSSLTAIIIGAYERAIENYKECFSMLEETYAKPVIAKDMATVLKLKRTQK